MSLFYYLESRTSGHRSQMVEGWALMAAHLAKLGGPDALSRDLTLKVLFDGSARPACVYCGAILDAGEDYACCDRCLREYEAKLAGFASLEAEEEWYCLMADNAPDDGPSDADPGL